MTTPTDRDVARRRRRWLAFNVYGLPALNLVAVVAVWIEHGLWPSAALLLMTMSLVTLGLGGLSQYRYGYWRGRMDMHYERDLRRIGETPTPCPRAEPWAADPPDDIALDLLRAFGRGPWR